MKTSFWQRWWQSVRGGKRSGPVARGGLRRQALRLEALEDRTLLSGTPHLLQDINPTSLPSNPSDLVVIGSTTYFSADDGIHGRELWKSDGTAAGTSMVADINPGSAYSNASNLTNVNGTLFFTAYDGTHPNALWKSDGTAAGTVLVKDIGPSGGRYPGNLKNVNGNLYFAGNDGFGSGGHGYELWKSDGTTAGTVMIKDINPGSASSYPGFLTNVNGTLFFSATDGTHGTQLWKSDGTTAGTVMVTNSNPGNPAYLTNVNGTLLFRAADSVHGYELWKSDGTTAGTAMIKDNNPG